MNDRGLFEIDIFGQIKADFPCIIYVRKKSTKIEVRVSAAQKKACTDFYCIFLDVIYTINFKRVWFIFSKEPIHII